MMNPRSAVRAQPDALRTRLELQNGVSCVFVGSTKSAEATVNVWFRCRDNSTARTDAICFGSRVYVGMGKPPLFRS